MQKDNPIKIGISTCLLGYNVRFDGGHKRDRYITDTLSNYFEFVPFCPEVEVGMGVPRESIRLEGPAENPRLVRSKSGEDWTDRMDALRKKRIEQMKKLNLSGYIFKKDSPSCGMERVKIYGGKGAPSKDAKGFFGGAIVDAFPLLPIEEEGRLNDPGLRENFIERVFSYHRLQNLFKSGFKPRDVVEFHAANKYLIMAHSPKHYKEMGQLVAAIKRYKPENFAEKYIKEFMDALSIKTTIKKNVNVMHHIMGYLKKELTSEDKKYILGTIEDYRGQMVPLVVPLTLIKHYIEKFDIDYIKNQLYLSPHPKELMLRNHV